MIHADALHVVHGALEVEGFLAVELEERQAVFHDLLGALHLDKELAGLGLDAAVAADVQLPAGVHTDDADVLDAGFGAVARAAGNGQLDLVWRPHVEKGVFQIDAHLRRVLRAETAEFAADTGLHGTDGFAVGVAGRHIQVFPDTRQVFLPDAQQVDALAAGDLDHRHLILVRHIGDAPQLGGIGNAAPHAWNDRIGTILLDVGVGALVDEARLRVILGFARPGGDQVVVQRRPAGGAAVWRAPFHEGHGRRNAGQVVLANGLAHLAVVKVAAATDGLLALRLDVGGAADGVDQDLFDQPGTGAARAGGLGVLFHLVHREQPVFLDRLDDGALAHAIAAAHFHIVGHGHGLALALVASIADGALAKHQMVADLAHVLALAYLAEVPAAIGGITVQAGADQHVVLDHQLLVDTADGVGEGDGLGTVAADEIASREQVDAGDL